MREPFATLLHMLPDLIRKLTVVIALVLVGLVGGVGTGLHSVFDCCHHCYHSCGSSARCPAVADDVPVADHCNCVFCHTVATSSTYSQLSKSTDRATHSQNGWVAESQHDCAICRLLSHFHSTPTADSPEHYVWASRGIVAISIPAAIPDTSLRLEPSRGPPA